MTGHNHQATSSLVQTITHQGGGKMGLAWSTIHQSSPYSTGGTYWMPESHSWQSLCMCRVSIVMTSLGPRPQNHSQCRSFQHHVHNTGMWFGNETKWLSALFTFILFTRLFSKPHMPCMSLPVDRWYWKWFMLGVVLGLGPRLLIFTP